MIQGPLTSSLSLSILFSSSSFLFRAFSLQTRQCTSPPQEYAASRVPDKRVREAQRKPFTESFHKSLSGGRVSLPKPFLRSVPLALTGYPGPKPLYL